MHLAVDLVRVGLADGPLGLQLGAEPLELLPQGREDALALLNALLALLLYAVPHPPRPRLECQQPREHGLDGPVELALQVVVAAVELLRVPPLEVRYEPGQLGHLLVELLAHRLHLPQLLLVHLLQQPTLLGPGLHLLLQVGADLLDPALQGAQLLALVCLWLSFILHRPNPRRGLARRRLHERGATAPHSGPRGAFGRGQPDGRLHRRCTRRLQAPRAAAGPGGGRRAHAGGARRRHAGPTLRGRRRKLA
mmetsp:Transcript_23969/g.62533  ORF Transcript_23969/g.62533 Transcript_23969/m.62533 type:complete len:251 (-) Transcript_23969:3-755(-)